VLPEFPPIMIHDHCKMRIRFFSGLLACVVLLSNTGFCDEKADTYYNQAIRLDRGTSLEQVFELYARSAELGHPVAQYNLAMMYANGEFVNVDYQQAVYWFRKSAQQDFSPAQYRLGELYYFNRGGLKGDLAKAVALFTKAAEQNDPEAQMNLAILYGTGEGVPLDTEKALFWLRRANKDGHESAHQYEQMLMASEDGKFSLQQQKNYWLEKAMQLKARQARHQ